jgi:hypothetical protein
MMNWFSLGCQVVEEAIHLQSKRNWRSDIGGDHSEAMRLQIVRTGKSLIEPLPNFVPGVSSPTHQSPTHQLLESNVRVGDTSE